MTSTSPQPPYLGSAYYPETWPLEQIDEDVRLMQAAGMNIARLAEFAWARMEPREGEFDFAWLHLAIDKLATAGIASILCTPTCTPPHWLVNRHPEICFVKPDGTRSIHGARRHGCPTQPVYRDYCVKIVRRMAEEFGANPHVIGWQIDNEVHPQGPAPYRSCCCDSCVAQFRDRMRRRWGTIEALNAAWNLNLWSQAYESFETLPLPRTDTWHHPSLLHAWAEFSSDAYAGFIAAQAEILHQHVKVPVGTDMMPTSALDYVEIHRPLDLVQFNHYHDMTNLWEAAFWFDFIRPLKSAPFWNTETQTCWNGSTAVTQGSKAPGWCRANSWLPIALGGEANLYWLWRQHWAGQELAHGSVITAQGRPQHIFDEVREISAGFDKAGEFLRATKPTRSGVALLWSQRTQRMFIAQPTLSPEFNYERAIQERIYKPLLQGHWRPDVITPEAPLENYQVIVAPLLLSLEEAGLADRLEAWVSAGGTLLIGPSSDVRNLEGALYLNALFGHLEAWTGVRGLFTMPGFPETFSYEREARGCAGSLCYEALEPNGAEVLALYTAGWMQGHAAITRSRLGAGSVVQLGTLPEADELDRLVAMLCSQANLERIAQSTPNLVVVPRSGHEQRGWVVVEIFNRTGMLTLDSPVTDLISGERLRGAISIPRYGVRVLQA